MTDPGPAAHTSATTRLAHPTGTPVPHLIGLTGTAARAVAWDNGADIVVQERDEVPADATVTAQVPLPRGLLRRGARIWLWTTPAGSSGPTGPAAGGRSDLLARAARERDQDAG